MNKTDNSLFFTVKKTTELTDQEIDQLLYLNNTTMNEQRTKKNFQDKYLLNFLGFSFHSLMIENNIIVGCNTVIPQEFIFFDKKCIFGQWCETLIDKNFRGAFSNFKKLGNILNEELLKHEICFIYGLPNRALYIVSKRLLGMRDIGKLDYYVYPKKLNKFLVKYYPLNKLLCFFFKILLKFKFKSKINYIFPIHKLDNENFYKGRYGNRNEYKTIIKNNFKLIYKIDISDHHNGAKIIWIMDVSPLTKLNLESSVNELKKIDNNTDLIIYIGKLKLSPYNLIKIPDKFIKENNIFSGKILDEKKVDESVFDFNLWNVNSSNFDYR